MKKTIAEAICNSKVIPVFYHEEVSSCKAVLDACYKGGIKAVEYLNRGSAAENNFPILKDHVRMHCPGMVLGAGSVLNRQQAYQFIQLGADFIVSPFLSKEIAQASNDHDIFWIPGCATPTEIASALELGADIIKVFPGNVLGPGFIKSVLGPMPGLKLMPTGGVEPTYTNLKAWFNAGTSCVGMGSNLIDSKLIKNPELLTKKIQEILEIINNIIDEDA